MKYLIIYGTVEGHTRKVADHISGRLISKGDDVNVEDASMVSSDLSISDYDACIVAASVYDRQYPEAITRFVRARVKDLNAIPTAFVSVGLAMALEGGEAEAQSYIEKLLNDTGWTPNSTHNAAGAIRNRECDFFQQQIVRYIVMKHCPGSTLAGIHEFTDWKALDEFVDEFSSKT